MLKLFHRRYSQAGLTVGLLLMCGPAITPASTQDQGRPNTPSSPTAEVAWQLNLPSSQTLRYTTYHLLDGRIYAIGTDGTVASVQANNGHIVWMRRLADEGDELWPPATYHSSKEDAVGFTRLHDLLLVDPKNGLPTHTLKAVKPNVGPASFSPGHAYLATAGAHLAAYRLKDEYIYWRASFDATLSIPLIYVPALDLVAAVDDGGLVAGLDAEDRAKKRVIFKQKLCSRPRGWLAVDGSMLYLSTDNQLLHAIAMGPTGEKKKQGEIVWQYRLAKNPEGGPILTETAIYQATIGGGLHRIPKFPGEFKAWYAPDAQRFMADWPQGIVVLTNDAKLALIRDDPAKLTIIADVRGFATGISNTMNDAIFLTTPEGTIRCLRPANATPLKLANFIPISSSAPAEDEPETFHERLRRENLERKSKLVKKPPTQTKTPSVSKAASIAVAATPATATTTTPPPPTDPLRSNIPVVK